MVSSNLAFCKYGLQVRLVSIEDAAFICRLRNNSTLNKHLNQTSDSILDQIKWIEDYKIREKENKEFYFIFSINEEPLGVERIYNLSEVNFTFGSLIFDIIAPASAAIMADIITKEFGYEQLGYNIALFDVRKNNKSVLKYHQGYSPELINEDESNFYFSLEKIKFENRKNELLKIFKKNGS